MIFFWVFQLASLLFLLVSRYFFGAYIGTDTLVLSFLILISTPLLIPVVALIREDNTRMRPIFTQVGVNWVISMLLISFGLLFGFHIEYSTFFFIFILMFSVFFAIESRIFFLVALMWLIATVSALIVGKSTFAESASIIVYLALVIGVFVEIGAPLFKKIHLDSKMLIEVTSEFRQGYRSALSDYAWIMIGLIQSIFFVALIGRGFLWNFDYQMLLYLAFWVWIFSMLYLFSHERILHIWDFIIDRFSRKYYSDSYRNNKEYMNYGIIGSTILILVSMIDWTSIVRLPYLTIICFPLFTILIMISIYRIHSLFYHR